MIKEIKNIKSTKSDLRKFGLSVGIILILISSFLFWKNKGAFRYVFAIAVILLGSGVAIPLILKPVYVVWMIFATILSWVMTRLILSLLFYLVFTPIGLVALVFGKQFLELKWNKSNNTYWNYRNTKQLPRDNYEKQF